MSMTGVTMAGGGLALLLGLTLLVPGPMAPVKYLGSAR